MRKYKNITDFKNDKTQLPDKLRNEIISQLEIASEFSSKDIFDVILLGKNENNKILYKEYPFIVNQDPGVKEFIDCGKDRYINEIFVINSCECVSIFSKQ